MDLQRINVVFIYVADLERARHFYEETLGLGKPLLKARHWIEYQLGGGTNLALHKSLPEALEGIDRSRNTISFSMVVPDLEEAHAELSAKGVTFVRPPEKGFGFNIAEFEDPEGNRLRLLQYTTLKMPKDRDAAGAR